MFIILMFSYILAVATVVAGLLLPLQDQRQLTRFIVLVKLIILLIFKYLYLSIVLIFINRSPIVNNLEGIH